MEWEPSMGVFLEARQVTGTAWEWEAPLGPKQPCPNLHSTGQRAAQASNSPLACRARREVGSGGNTSWKDLVPEEVKIGRGSPEQLQVKAQGGASLGVGEQNQAREDLGILRVRETGRPPLSLGERPLSRRRVPGWVSGRED